MSNQEPSQRTSVVRNLKTRLGNMVKDDGHVRGLNLLKHYMEGKANAAFDDSGVKSGNIWHLGVWTLT